MHKIILTSLCVALSLLCFVEQVDAVIKVPSGRIRNADDTPFLSLEEHQEQAAKFLEAENYREAARHNKILTIGWPESPEGVEAHYFLALSYYKLCEFDWANETFNKYIQLQSNTDKFEKVIEYKFAIAEYLRTGSKRRFFGTKYMPKLASGKELALDIYDEIVVAMPIGELAPKALFLKGLLQFEMNRYRDAVDSLQTVIKRFPKHELSPESYVAINRIFLEQARTEVQNPDILAFADINSRRFARDFPGEPRLQQCQKDMLEIKEVYAQGLYEIGKFYEKIKEPLASVVYYQKACVDFPETKVSQECRSRLLVLTRGLVKTDEEINNTEDENELEDFDLLSKSM